MALLQEVSKPGSDVEEYVKGLNAILEHKLEIISVLRSRLMGFYYHLKQEEDLSKQFYQTQQPPDQPQDQPTATPAPSTEAEADLLHDEVNLEDFGPAQPF